MMQIALKGWRVEGGAYLNTRGKTTCLLNNSVLLTSTSPSLVFSITLFVLLLWAKRYLQQPPAQGLHFPEGLGHKRTESSLVSTLSTECMSSLRSIALGFLKYFTSSQTCVSFRKLTKRLRGLEYKSLPQSAREC